MAVVPIRSFADAKSRLGVVLDADQRRRLASNCAARVLTRAGLDRSVVVCNDDDVEQWAHALGVSTCRVEGRGLNRSLQAAIPRIVAEREPAEVVIVHADLAFPDVLTDLDTIVPYGTARTVTIVPDRHRDGTNVLALGFDILSQWRFSYGPGSFEAHCDHARSLGADLRVIDGSDLGFDLDTPQDLEDHRVRRAVAAIIPEWDSESVLPTGSPSVRSITSAITDSER